MKKRWIGVIVLVIATALMLIACGSGDEFSSAYKKSTGVASKAGAGTVGAADATSEEDAGMKATSGADESGGSGTTTKPSGGGAIGGATGGGGIGGASKPTSGGSIGGSSMNPSGGGGAAKGVGGAEPPAIDDSEPEGLLTMEEIEKRFGSKIKEQKQDFAKYQNIDFASIRKAKSDALWTLDEFWGPDANGDTSTFNSNLKKYGLEVKDIPKVEYEEVGRIDPLTPVIEALPEELRPPRSEETDVEAIKTYYLTVIGTMAVDSVDIEVYNIIQVGYRYQILCSIGGSGVTMEYDSSYGMGSSMDLTSGVGLTVTVTVTGCSSTSVTFTLSEAQSGVTKNKTFLR